MGKLVVTEFLTLDGVFQDPSGAGEFDRGGWAFQFERGDGDAFKFDELKASDAQLLGRVTYEGFAKAWPTMEGTGEFGEKMNAMPKFVVSTTLQNPEWNNTTVINGDLAEEVGKLKQQFAGDILVAGSGKLVSSLFAHDLVDELHLMVFPIVLGDGKRLFPNAEATRSLKLVETKQTGSVAILTLRRAED